MHKTARMPFRKIRVQRERNSDTAIDDSGIEKTSPGSRKFNFVRLDQTDDRAEPRTAQRIPLSSIVVRTLSVKKIPPIPHSAGFYEKH
jgi:hypothetical protein